MVYAIWNQTVNVSFWPGFSRSNPAPEFRQFTAPHWGSILIKPLVPSLFHTCHWLKLSDTVNSTSSSWAVVPAEVKKPVMGFPWGQPLTQKVFSSSVSYTCSPVGIWQLFFTHFLSRGTRNHSGAIKFVCRPKVRGISVLPVFSKVKD